MTARSADAVPVVVRQDDQPVVHLTGRLPLRVGAPRRGPQAATGVHAELYGIHELRKHLLGREDVGTESGLETHLVDSLLGGQKVERAELAQTLLFLRLVEVRDDLDRCGDAGVVRLNRLSVGRRPDDAVPVRRHAIELHQLVLQNVVVRLAIRERERRPGAPHVVAVRGPIAVEPVAVLVEHGGPDRVDRTRVGGGRRGPSLHGR